MMRISAPKRELFLPLGKMIIKEAHSSSNARKHVTTKLLGNEKSGHFSGTFNQKISKQSHTVINKAVSSEKGQMESVPFCTVIHHESEIEMVTEINKNKITIVIVHTDTFICKYTHTHTSRI